MCKGIEVEVNMSCPVSKQNSLIRVKSLKKYDEIVGVYFVRDTAMLGLVPKRNKQGKMFSLGNKWPQVQEQFHCSQKLCSSSKTSNTMVEKYSDSSAVQELLQPLQELL